MSLWLAGTLTWLWWMKVWPWIPAAGSRGRQSSMASRLTWPIQCILGQPEQQSNTLSLSLYLSLSSYIYGVCVCVYPYIYIYMSHKVHMWKAIKLIKKKNSSSLIDWRSSRYQFFSQSQIQWNLSKFILDINKVILRFMRRVKTQTSQHNTKGRSEDWCYRM